MQDTQLNIFINKLNKQIMTYKDYLKNELNYDSITTFWEDFAIAEVFGIDGVKETFNVAFNEWKDNYLFLTELVMVLNHRCCRAYETNRELSEVYNDLWIIADEYAVNNLKDDELDYYFEILD